MKSTKHIENGVLSSVNKNHSDKTYTSFNSGFDQADDLLKRSIGDSK